MEQSAVVSPMPRYFKGPQKRYDLIQVPGFRKYQISIPEHQEEHCEKED